jgi:cell division protease FtsH
MSHLSSLLASLRPLSEVFIDALRRSANSSSAFVGRNRNDDDRDHAEQQSLALEDEDAVGWQPDAVGTILPDQVLAAVILGHALDRNREAIATIAKGGVVVIEAPSAALVAPLCRVLRRCLFDPAWTIKDGGNLRPADARGVAPETLVLFDRDGTQSSHAADVGNTEVGIALQMRGPIVGLAADADQTLPSDLVRIADQRLALSPIDVDAISAVIAAVTGKPPTSIESQLATLTTPADLVLAVRSDRGPDDCVERLRRLVNSKKVDHDAPIEPFDLNALGPAKVWVTELLDDLRDYKAGRIPWSALNSPAALLSSPPGCGKTALARWLAKSAGVYFLATSYSAWQAQRDGHLGSVTRAIRNVFAEARANAPSILFIDEIDSLPARGSDKNHDSWFTSVTNCLLEELDGFQRREGVIVIAACNSPPEKLDPALLRSGRLDRNILIELPDPIALAGILRAHLGQDLEGVDLRPTAAAANGGTGADAERWVRGARRRARKAGRAVTLDDLFAEIREGRATIPVDVRRRIAYHEASHAICAILLGVGVPHSLAMHMLGGTTLVERSAVNAQTAADIKRLMAYIMAGRAGEDLVFGDVCAGSGGGGEHCDLGLATDLAVRIEAIYGLGAQGPLWFGAEHKADLLRVPEIRAAARRTLEQAQAEARQLLQAHRSALDRLAAALLAKDFLDRDEIQAAVHPLVIVNSTDEPPNDVPAADASRL